jgi:5-methylcytosine-specific restriction endonuclease McrA
MSGDTLLLNSDAQPVTWLPLSTLNWQESIRYLVLEKARALEWHDHWIVRSARWETAVPSVMMLIDYMKPKTTIRFNKSNVFLRDQYTCAYCEKKLEKSGCTIDHILPISHGGKTNFENTVTACGPCNSKKGNNKKIVPKIKPHKPDIWELVNKRKKFPFQVRYEVWKEYIKF